ncbi:unnamed protein product [Rotaria sp. Silwood2]|nr:unnamed protein product [Rotaria sp. Silwood2]CAF3275249.1 unnamed protein product [Rotaria sp. Silwood2]CAF4447115.1 unnamed protein product [Rotaria sp. Silwood2]CAF4693403.1 unnamed protein product [Rotaria sp. Silwood2]
MHELVVNSSVIIYDKLSQNIYRYGIPSTCIFGLTGHIINLFLFTRPTLIYSSCCNYFLASSCVALFQILFSQPIHFLQLGLGIDLTNIWWCRIRFYVAHSAYMTSSFLITLASADRFASSCRQVKHRRWANFTIARKLIPIVIIIACAVNIHILGMFTINHEHRNECWAPHGNIYRFIFDIILVSHIIIYPILIGTFGLLTVYNIRRSHIQQQLLSFNCRVRDLQRMTLVQTVCIIVFTLPYAILKLHRTIMTSNNNDVSDIYWAVERLITCFVDFGCYINDGAGFYIYSLSSITFRRTLLQFINEHRSILFRCYQYKKRIIYFSNPSITLIT